jgi:ribosomal-protein-alanine N-acetyltransferase
VWVENIGVDPEFRRMGIGYMLMRRLAEEGKNQGAQIIHSSISIDNTKSLLLHRKLGFLAETRKVAVLDLSTFH